KPLSSSMSFGTPVAGLSQARQLLTQIDKPMVHAATPWGALPRCNCRKISACITKSGGTRSVGMKNAAPREPGGLGDADNALVIGKEEVGSTFDIKDPDCQHRPRRANGEPQDCNNRKYGCSQITIGRRIGKSWRQGWRHDAGHEKSEPHEPERE